jgi:hypothetical protein
MLSDFLKANLKSNASYVDYGFGQVEPNHLSAQRTGQIYAQLPADKEITMLEQGQFVKYDYAKGCVNFTGEGEWMLVYNEIKLYREHQMDCEFAMIKDNYQARVYSPFGTEGEDRQTRFYNGVDAKGNPIEDVTAGPDIYELHYNEDPFHITGPYKEAMMPEGTTMVPRVFKTNVGDIFTTNTVKAESLKVGDVLTPGADGILAVGEGAMKWQVVKVYTMPDGQKGVKIMRIA